MVARDVSNITPPTLKRSHSSLSTSCSAGSWTDSAGSSLIGENVDILSCRSEIIFVKTEDTIVMLRFQEIPNKFTFLPYFGKRKQVSRQCRNTHPTKDPDIPLTSIPNKLGHIYIRHFGLPYVYIRTVHNWAYFRRICKIARGHVSKIK